MEEIPYLDKDLVLFNLRYLQNSHLSIDRKKMVYLLIKGERLLSEFQLEELMQMGVFLTGIPSPDFNEFDFNKWDIISYLGQVNLDQSALGILAFNLKKHHGDEVYLNYKCINKLYGIICGFDVADLAHINDDNFILINEDIFENLDKCSEHQMQVLYSIAIRPTVYGIPQGWNKSVLKSIGLLMGVVPLVDIDEMDPSAFEGLKRKTLKFLDIEKIEHFDAQVKYFRSDTLFEYQKIIRIPSI